MGIFAQMMLFHILIWIAEHPSMADLSAPTEGWINFLSGIIDWLQQFHSGVPQGLDRIERTRLSS